MELSMCELGKAEALDSSLFEGTTTSLSDISLAIYSTVYAYYGWSVNYMGALLRISGPCGVTKTITVRFIASGPNNEPLHFH